MAQGTKVVVGGGGGETGVYGTVPTISENLNGTNGTITAGICTVALYSNAVFSGTPSRYNIAQKIWTEGVGGVGTTLFAPGSTTYIVVDYNSGTPIYNAISNVELINESNIIPVFTVYRDYSNNIHVVEWDRNAEGLANKIHQRMVKCRRYEAEPGALRVTQNPIDLTELDVSGGKVWIGVSRLDLGAITDAQNGSYAWEFWAISGGVWSIQSTSSTQRAYNNSQYNPPTGLATLSNNHYTINWIYRDMDADHLRVAYVVCEDEYPSVADALNDPPRDDLPSNFTSVFTLIGRAIVLKGSTGASDIVVQSAFDVNFGSAHSIPDHNGLDGLNTGEYIHLTSTQGTAITNQNPEVFGADYLHGFGDVASTLSFNNGTQTLTISGTNWNYYYKGKKVTVPTTATCNLNNFAGFPALGIWFIYFDGIDYVNNIKASQTPWTLSEHVPIATVYWDTTGSKGATGDERHYCRRDIQWHRWAHSTIGTRYRTGLALTSPATGTDAAISIGSGTIADEDLEISIPPVTNSRVWYQGLSGLWHFTDSTKPFHDADADNLPEWPASNNSYTLTEIANGRYLPVFCYASNDIDRPIYIVVPSFNSTTDIYTTAAQVRAATIGNPPSPPSAQELKYIYRFIYNGGTGAISYDATQDDFRTTSTVTSSGAPNTTAGSVSVTPYGSISSTNVQGALQELDDKGKWLIRNNTNSPVAMESWVNYFVNCTNGNVEMRLPASPSTGDTIIIDDYRGQSAGTYNITVTSSTGSTFTLEGSTGQTLTINVAKSRVVLTYVGNDGADYGWRYVVI